MRSGKAPPRRAGDRVPKTAGAENQLSFLDSLHARGVPKGQGASVLPEANEIDGTEKPILSVKVLRGLSAVVGRIRSRLGGDDETTE